MHQGSKALHNTFFLKTRNIVQHSLIRRNRDYKAPEAPNTASFLGRVLGRREQVSDYSPKICPTSTFRCFAPAKIQSDVVLEEREETCNSEFFLSEDPALHNTMHCVRAHERGTYSARRLHASREMIRQSSGRASLTKICRLERHQQEHHCFQCGILSRA